MPKKTFHNLNDKKRQSFIDAFLLEFTVNRYDDASISSVLKELKLAKGSFYQYFENKRELFDYLIGICFQKKQEYLHHVQRGSFPDFWSYWRATYEEGLKFDAAHPLMSNFNYCLTDNLNSPSLKKVYNQWYQHGHAVTKSMVQKEVDAGLFRADMPTETVATFLMNVGNQILDTAKLHDSEGFEHRLKDGHPLLVGQHEKLLFKIVDDSIKLLSAALNK